MDKIGTVRVVRAAIRTKKKTQDEVIAIDTKDALPHLAKVQVFTEQILKVKVTGGEKNFREVCIIYQMVNDRHEPITCDLTLGEKPHPDLFTALNALLALSVTYGGLDKDVWLNGRVSGVSIKTTGANEFGVNVTAMCPISGLDSPALSNTPYLSHDLLTTKEQALLRSVIEQARLFIWGKRAQMELGL